MAKVNNRRKARKRDERKGFNAQSIYRNEIVRLKRKITMYQKQESALMKILDIVRDQMTKVEVEGLQIAANKRQLEEKEFCDEMNLDSIIKLPLNQNYPENIDEINKFELKLEENLDEMFFQSNCLETEEEEDQLELTYLQG